MKKILLFLMMFFAANSFAVESCVYTYNCWGSVCLITTTWTAAPDDGTLTCAATTIPEAGKIATILAVTTDPGGTAPTDLYDITLPDSTGLDASAGQLANRSATLTEIVSPQLTSGTEWIIPFIGPITHTLTNNSVNDATGVTYIWIKYL